MDQRFVKPLQRIVSSIDERFLLTQTLSDFITIYALGLIKGKSCYFNEIDKQEIRELLEKKGHGLEIVETGHLARIDRLEHSSFEKHPGEVLKKGRIDVKTLGMEPLLIDGRRIGLPVGAHLNVKVRSFLRSCGHSGVLVVENFECFDRIHEARINPDALSNPIVIYRGDSESRLDDVIDFLVSARLPVFAFADLDPSGLLASSRLPHFTGFLAPSPAAIEDALASPAARQDLFAKQYASCVAALEALPAEHPCRTLWMACKAHRAGFVQEGWLARGCDLTIYR